MKYMLFQHFPASLTHQRIAQGQFLFQHLYILLKFLDLSLNTTGHFMRSHRQYNIA